MRRILIVLATAATIFGVGAVPAHASEEGDRVTLRVYSVYSQVNLTFTDEYGDTEKLGNRRLNTRRDGYWIAWSSFTTKTPFALDTVEVADTTGRSDAWVRCLIYVNGNLKYKQTDSGAYASAYC